ncbi:MAG: formate--tetrahydrofolate ligase [Pseudomonadota bacterium]
MSDIDIARQAQLKPVRELAAQQFNITDEHLEPYGHYKAKLKTSFAEQLETDKRGKLILVTAISPTPAGEGKTTTTVGLGDALNRIGKQTLICLREPSLGPCFGIKGGAAGGGYAQVVPMEDINLHFTGDFHAIGAANNLLAAMVDNHISHGNALNIDPRTITWKRAVDMNDRALRKIVNSLGGSANGFPREDGFDITVASEVMAIFCLASSLDDLKTRLGKIIVAYSRGDKTPVTAADLNAHGAMTVLLKDAINPNLVQTLENNLAFVHGGPFANIAHGCNSVLATKTALKLADYVVTEAGFGADLGAEKFIDIKCRMSGLNPEAVVLVTTVRALKYHGGAALDSLNDENLEALEKGCSNFERHLSNIRENYGLPCIVSINHFTNDTDAEIELLKMKTESLGGHAVVAKHWADGGAGAEDLANEVVRVLDEEPGEHKFVYDDEASLWDKIKSVAQKIYGAADISAPAKIKQQIESLNEDYGSFPVCIAKTQMSFSTDARARGAPSGHVVEIREVKLAAGAGFLVAIAGDIMTMPGLPKSPAAERIDLDQDGNIVGLF